MSAYLIDRIIISLPCRIVGHTVIGIVPGQVSFLLAASADGSAICDRHICLDRRLGNAADDVDAELKSLARGPNPPAR